MGMLLGAVTMCLPIGQAGGTPQAQATSPRPSYHLSADGDIYIAPDGTVIDYKLDSKDLAPEVAKLVDARIRRWRFEPIRLDGKPVIAKTRMTVELDAIPVADGYQLRVAGVGFGNPRRTHPENMKPPRYPLPARRAGVEAQVLLLLSVDAQGKVAKVEIQSTSLSGKGPQQVMTQWADMFEDSAGDAARHWHFEMTEQVGGQPLALTRVRVPVTYRMEDHRGWHALVPVVRPGHYAKIAVDERIAAAAAGPGDQEPRSLDSRFKLRDKVVGTTL